MVSVRTHVIELLCMPFKSCFGTTSDYDDTAEEEIVNQRPKTARGPQPAPARAQVMRPPHTGPDVTESTPLFIHQGPPVSGSSMRYPDRYSTNQGVAVDLAHVVPKKRVTFHLAAGEPYTKHAGITEPIAMTVTKGKSITFNISYNLDQQAQQQQRSTLGWHKNRSTTSLHQQQQQHLRHEVAIKGEERTQVTRNRGRPTLYSLAEALEGFDGGASGPGFAGGYLKSTPMKFVAQRQSSIEKGKGKTSQQQIERLEFTLSDFFGSGMKDEEDEDTGDDSEDEDEDSSEDESDDVESIASSDSSTCSARSVTNSTRGAECVRG